MPKLVILKFDGGNFQNGFNGTLQIGNEGEHLANVISGKLLLPPNPTMPEKYRRWQSDFLDLEKRLRGRRGGSRIFDPNQILKQCQQSAKDFIEGFKKWLNSQDSALQNLREKLCQQLGNPKEPIRVIIQTDDPLLKKLPWHEMDLFANTYTQAEVALCPTEYEKSSVAQISDKTSVRILAILGNSEGIDVKSDEQSLKNLEPRGVAIQFLPEPKRTEISDSLWEQNWDILFFAGHSSSQNDEGRIYINCSPNLEENSLTIEELKFGLKKAINHGLQLAILNSCDGLKLAEDLADLNIPQVIVMREPVPDLVAQTFLQFFLSAFTGGESLYVAVRHARERLHENGLDDKFPGASWLPIIYQNPTVIPPSWDQLKTPEIGNRYRGSKPHKPITSQPLRDNKPDIDIFNGDEGGIMSKLSNVQFLLTHFLPGLIAGVAGLSLAVVLFIYKDIIAKDIFPQLTQTQATIVIFSIIGLTFFIAIIGIYAWLATKKDIQFKYVVVFMILILTILAFISAGVYYIVTQNDKPLSEEIVSNGKNHPSEPLNYWYLKAIEALNSGKKENALPYIDKGLKKVPKNEVKQIASLLALKIKVLLLIGGSDNQAKAGNVANQNYGSSSALDRWINCLKEEKIFSSIITTETELEAKCPSPI